MAFAWDATEPQEIPRLWAPIGGRWLGVGPPNPTHFSSARGGGFERHPYLEKPHIRILGPHSSCDDAGWPVRCERTLVCPHKKVSGHAVRLHQHPRAFKLSQACTLVTRHYGEKPVTSTPNRISKPSTCPKSTNPSRDRSRICEAPN